MLYYILSHLLDLRIAHKELEGLVSLERRRKVHGRDIKLYLSTGPVIVHVIGDKLQLLGLVRIFKELCDLSEILDNLLLDIVLHL